MELGGKANAIVLKDADLKNAAMQCTLGAFLNVSHILVLNMVGQVPDCFVLVGWPNLHVDGTHSGSYFCRQ